MFISLRTIFLEKEFLTEGMKVSKIELGEVQEVERPTQSETPIEPIRSNPKPIEASVRRSDRVSRQPDRYYGFLVRDCDPVELDENNEDPITYMDAMERSDSDKWLGAMKFEMESMDINGV